MNTLKDIRQCHFCCCCCINDLKRYVFVTVTVSDLKMTKVSYGCSFNFWRMHIFFCWAPFPTQFSEFSHTAQSHHMLTPFSITQSEWADKNSGQFSLDDVARNRFYCCLCLRHVLLLLSSPNPFNRNFFQCWFLYMLFGDARCEKIDTKFSFRYGFSWGVNNNKSLDP